MNVYVAAKTHDVRRAQKVIGWLRDCGHHVTYDWTEGVVRLGDANEADLSPEVQKGIAERDRKGVLEARLVVALGHPLVCGTLIEVGMACAFGTPVWLVGEWPRSSVFFFLESVTRIHNDDALRKHVEAL